MMKPLHSIVLPHRDRNRNLAWCLNSLEYSAGQCGNPLWELVVVDGGSEVVPTEGEHVKVISAAAETPFNKSRLLNIGIEAARGDLITFLDADALVGPLFMSAALEMFSREDTLTKVCYRVWHVTEESTALLDEAPWTETIYRTLQCASLSFDFEGYGLPHKGNHPKGHLLPVFGNSQQTIRRSTLGDCRFDEAYIGRGFEDIDFNTALWAQHGAAYKALMITDPMQAMCHIVNNPFDGHWGSVNYNLANRRRYFGKWNRKLWKKKPSRIVRS